MSKNTTDKGNKLENLIYDLLNKQGMIGLSSHNTIVKKKPTYYSAKREKQIVFDLSVEFYLYINSTPTCIFIIECKNYNSLVPVDDLEEFSAKLNQVAEHNSKGIIVTTKGFQEGSLKFAKNTGIGLWLF